MPNADDVLKKFHDVTTKMADQNESLQEKVAKVEADANAAYAEMKAWRAENVSASAPLDDVQAMHATQPGGIFGGKFQIPYQNMISLPASNPILNNNEKERLRAIQDLHDACVLRFYSYARKLRAGQGAQQIFEKLSQTTDFKLYAHHLVSAGYFKAADDILNPGSGTGANLDFTLLSAQLIDLIEVNALLPSMFPKFTLTTSTQEIPAFRAGVKAVAGGTTAVPLPQDDLAGTPWDISSPIAAATKKPTFGKIKFVAKHCLGFIMYTDDMLEDSIVPILPILRGEAVSMINLAREDAIINGDVTATHMDFDTNALGTEVFAKQFNGLRHMGESHEVDSAATIIAAADANLMLQKMGKYAQRLDEIIWIMNVKEWLRLAADTQLQTVDKAGDRATLAKGVVNQLSGVNIVLSPEIRRDLATTGVNTTGGPNVSATTIMVNKTRLYLAEKNRLDVESVRVPQALANWVQADLRTDFQPKDLDSGTATFTGVPDSPVVRQIDILTT